MYSIIHSQQSRQHGQNKETDDPRQETLPDDEFLQLFDVDHEKFTKREAQKIRDILIKYKLLFALNSHQLGCLRGYEYKIELTDDTPVKQRYRPVNPRHYDKLQQQLKVMLETGVIKKCISPWASPVTIAEKPDGDIRICIDFRRLNLQCKRDAKPIPRINETLEWMAGNSMFSSVDLMSGYWQIPLAKDSIELTAFTAGSEQLYAFQRIPFGHTSSGNYFQRAMEDVLKGLIYKHCLVYLDDVCILSKNFDGHIEAMDLVFERMYSSGLRLKPKKCKLFKKELKFLGHMVSGEGIKCDPEKVKLIKEWKEPESTRDCRKFLGVVGYYRKFITNFSKRASPITDLLKGKTVKRGKSTKFVPVTFYWNDAQQKSFDDLKTTLLDEIVLKYPDYHRPFILEIDASRGAYGAVLSQEVDGRRLPVAFASKKTSSTEQVYPAHKLEFAALRWAVCQKFREYLHHSFVDVYTDSNPVVYILNKMDIDAVSQRWCAELAKFDFKIHYRTGKSNTAADSLSRIAEPDQVDPVIMKRWCQDIDATQHVIQEPVVKAIFMSGDEHIPTTEQSLIASIQNKNISDDSDHTLEKIDLLVGDNNRIDFRQVQADDPDIQYIIEHVLNKPKLKYDVVKEKNQMIKGLYKKRSKLVMEDGILYKQFTREGICKKQLVGNKSCTEVLVNAYHNKQAHLGQERTLAAITDRFYWPRMHEDIVDTLKGCVICQSRKTLPALNKEEMHHRPLAKYPMDIISMDHLTIDNRDGNLKVLTIVDEYSKYLWVIPVKRENATMTADSIMNSVFLKYGLPNTIHSDQGKAFNNRLIDKLMDISGVSRTMSTPYWSQGNAIAERYNSVILDMLGTLKPEEKRRWHKHCDYIAYAYNTSINSATGMSPHFLMFGKHPRLIGDALLNIELEQRSHDTVDRFSQNLKTAYAKCTSQLERQRIKYKRFYDSKRPRNIIKLQVDDIVLVKNERLHNKIDNRWSSNPYIVLSQPDEDIPVFKVKELQGQIVRAKHRNQLLPVYRAQDIVLPKKQRHTKEQAKKPKEQSSGEIHTTDSSDYQEVHIGIKPVTEQQSPNDDIGENGSHDMATSNVENTQVSDPGEVTDDYHSADAAEDSSNGRDSVRPIQDPGCVRTRSGRVVHPPVRYSPSHY